MDSASSDEGVFTILAVDHRDSMRALINPAAPDQVTSETLTDTKLELVRHMSDLASTVLLDPEYSVLPAIERDVMPPTGAFLCAIEAQGHLGDVNAPETTLLEGWGVERARSVGAAGVKLLLLYRPDLPVADRQDRLVQEVVAQCAHFDIPLFLEPISYKADQFAGRLGNDRRRIVIESVRRLGALGPDVLKVQFPSDTSTDDLDEWHDACAELDAASPVPWALLSGGDPYESFARQVEVACTNGASGFLVGRALWAEIVKASPNQLAALIDADMRPRFAALAASATELGSDWRTAASAPHRRSMQSGG